MSRIIKIALIIAVGGLAIAAKQATSTRTTNTASVALSAGPSVSISPMELTHGVGLLTETPVDSHF